MESDLPDLTYEPSASDSAPLLPLYSRTSRTSEDDSRGNDLHNRLKLRQLQPAGNFFSLNLFGKFNKCLKRKILLLQLANLAQQRFYNTHENCANLEMCLDTYVLFYFIKKNQFWYLEHT